MSSMQQEAIRDELFGELNYDPSMEQWYAQTAMATGRSIEVVIWWSQEKNGEFAPHLQRAKAGFGKFVDRAEELQLELAAVMLDSHESMATENTDASIAEFARGLSAREIAFSPDGRTSVYWDDAVELFADHSIEVMLDPDGFFLDFALHG